MTITIGNGGILNIESGGRVASGPVQVADIWTGWTGANNGTVQTLTLGAAANIVLRSLSPLDTDKFLLGWNQTGFQEFTRATVVSRSGNTVTNGTGYTTGSQTQLIGRNSFADSDTDRALMMYNIGSQATASRVLTVSGTTITGLAENSSTIPADNATSIDVTKLSTNKHIAVWSDNAAPQSTKVQIFTNSGSTVTGGTPVTIFGNAASTAQTHVVRLSDTKAVSAFNISGTVRIQVHENTVGTTVVNGTSVVFSSASIYYLIPIDESHVCIIYRGASNSTRARIYSITGTTLSLALGETVLDTALWTPDATSGNVQGHSDYAQMTSTEFMVVYSQTTPSSRTRAAVIRFPTPETIAITSTVTLTAIGGNANNMVLKNIDSTTNLLVYVLSPPSVARAMVLNL